MALLMIWFWPCGSALEWSALLDHRRTCAAAGAAAQAINSAKRTRRDMPGILVELRARLLHDLGPLVLLGADEGAELRGRLRPKLRSGLVEALLHLGRAEHLRDRGMQLVHDLGRRSGRRHDALEGAGLEAGHARG